MYLFYTVTLYLIISLYTHKSKYILYNVHILFTFTELLSCTGRHDGCIILGLILRVFLGLCSWRIDDGLYQRHVVSTGLWSLNAPIMCNVLGRIWVWKISLLVKGIYWNQQTTIKFIKIDMADLSFLLHAILYYSKLAIIIGLINPYTAE